jgi:uncharacterized protein (DUF1015 family)
VPIVAPFRALSYAPDLRKDLSRLIAPPYDVISDALRERLASRHPSNIVHVDLPRPPEGIDAYLHAADRLSALQREGALVRDRVEAFHVLEQRFRTPSGHSSTRRGFFARLRIEGFEAGVVIPHERTLDRPRADRLRLLSATRTHLSAVFMLHPDPGRQVSDLVERALAGAPVLEEAEDDGHACRLARLDGRDEVEAIRSRLAETWALVADGHHRYESALAYRDLRRKSGHRDAEHLLVFLCSLEDRGLAIFPIHRLVRSLPGFDRQGFLRKLGKHFTVAPVRAPDGLAAAMAGLRGQPGVFGMLFPGERAPSVVAWKPGAGLDLPVLASVPEPLRTLDVILLHRLVLEESLGITQEDQANQSYLDYVKDEGELARRLADPSAQVGVLMNPTRIEQVIEVTRLGLRLPQKSTYFYPKVPTGLVLDPLDP